jgi:hypothetical protein
MAFSLSICAVQQTGPIAGRDDARELVFRQGARRHTALLPRLQSIMRHSTGYIRLLIPACTPGLGNYK